MLFFIHLMRKMKINTKMYLASISFTLASLLCMAQDTPPPPMPPPPPGLPVDGAVGMVLILGLIYGILTVIKIKRS
jgi:hypothetical protein